MAVQRDISARRMPLGLAILLWLAHVLAAGWTDLGVDEAYALAIARPFALSYLDHPPLAFWLTGLTEALVGPDAPAFMLRLPFLVLSLGTVLVLMRLAARWGGVGASAWAAALFLLAPYVFVIGGSWIVPDGPLWLFSLLAILAFAPIAEATQIDGVSARHWLWTGVWLGLALLSKYHAGLVGLALVLFVLLSPAHRGWLRRLAPYLGALVTLAIFAPVLLWNAQHGWASFSYQAGRAGGDGFSVVAGLANLAGQAAYLAPATLLAALVALVLVRPTPPAPRLLLVLLAVLPVVLFTLVAFWGQHNLPHWPLIGWLFALLMLALWFGQGGRLRVILGTGLLTLGALWLSLILMFYTAVQQGWPIRLPDATARPMATEILSWRRLRPVLDAEGIALAPGDYLAATGWINAARAREALGEGAGLLVLGGAPGGFAFSDLPKPPVTGASALALVPAAQTEAAQALLAQRFETVEPLAWFDMPIEYSLALPFVVLRAEGFRP